MLHDFIELNRDELVARTSGKAASRPFESRNPQDIEYGVPLFLEQLVGTLRREKTGSPFPPNEIGSSAAKHGRELLGMGFTIAQVVHDYGDICQAITELAIELKAPITAEDFHTLNRCLDTAIAEAVSEHARLEQQASGREEVLRLGRLAHELRNQVHVALLSLEVLQRGAVGIGGSTGAVLARSVVGLRDLIDSALAEVRLEAGVHHRDQVSLRGFVGEIRDGGAASRRLTQDRAGGRHSRSGAGHQRGSAAPHVRADEPASQRLQIHPGLGSSGGQDTE